jgi:hypothetical protein
VDLVDPSAPLEHGECPALFTDNRTYPNDESLAVGYNGFGSVTFDGPSASADYIDINGTVIWRERWTVDGSGGVALDASGPAQ